MWTYATQLWGKASTSKIEVPERFQSKTLRIIVDAPCYEPIKVIRRDIQIPTVKEEMHRYSSQYLTRLTTHPNDLGLKHVELDKTDDCKETCQMTYLPDS
jgi:hypothetical protein